MIVPEPFNTPVLLIAFNRPHYTKVVFNAIRKAKPKYLYVAVDGPRDDCEEDVIAQNEIREIVSHVDWDCELHTLFRDKNLGCGLGPSEAISWALQNEEKIIVLEDDCVPNQSFFAFCDAMLDMYKDDTRIGLVSGRSYHYGSRFFAKQDYVFTHYAHTLGWATWKRCWSGFDIWMRDIPRYIEMGGAYNSIPIKKAATQINHRLLRIFNRIDSEVAHSWDSQCEYMFLKNHQLGIVPCRNLIEYIGWFGTHEFGVHSKTEAIATEELPNELRHPPFVMTDLGYEKLHYETHIKRNHPSIITRGFRKVWREIKLVLRRFHN